MRSFFRINYFFNWHKNGSAFQSLQTAVESGGGVAYQVAFMIAVYVALVTSVIALVKFFFSSKGRGRDEAKRAIERNVIIIMAIAGLLGFVTLLGRIFYWYV